MEQYKDKLTEGTVAMFKAYPEIFKMNVYPSRRTAAFPQSVYDAIKEQSTKAKLIKDGNGVSDVWGAIPFPIPANGHEAIWNHLLRYQGFSRKAIVNENVIYQNGVRLDMYGDMLNTSPFYDPNASDKDRKAGTLLKFVLTMQSPARFAGEGYLLLDVLDMAANTPDLGKLLATHIAPAIAEFGLEIPNLYIENISMPAAVEAALDKRTSMGLAGDLGSFTQYSAAEAMTQAASNPNGGGMGAGLGMGMGMAMAVALQNAGPWGARPTATAPQTPPPPVVERVWHIADKGKTTGPFSKANLGRMAADGSLKRDTHVWAVGLDGWKLAGDINELTQLFTIAPPPPPKG